MSRFVLTIKYIMHEDNLKYKSIKLMSKDWRHILISGAKCFGISLNNSQIFKMHIHAKKLIKWNITYNFTTIINPFEIAVKHILDSIAPVPFISKNAKILDIGSGGGFPGIPLKIVLPFISIVMVDSSRKKISFLDHIISILKLNNSSTTNTCCETLVNLNKYRNSFDVVICRAFKELNSFIEMVEPLLSQNGMIILLKGKFDSNIKINMNKNNNGYFIVKDQSFFVSNYFYQLPLDSSIRTLVLVKKNIC